MKSQNDYVCCFGEILWDLLPSGKMPGGAPMNVAIHLKNLGIDVACITCVGNDPLGEGLKDFLRSKQCADTWIQTDQHHPTGTVKVNVSDRTDVKYEIVFPVAWDFISATPQAMEISRDAYAFVFGTLACRNQQSREALFALLENTKAVKFFDVNLRAPHYSKDLMEPLLHRADIVKMNAEELQIIHDWFESSAMALEQQAQTIKSRFNLKKVIVTRGGDGAIMLDEGGLHQSKVYKVNVKDTIGSGDSFLAGMIKNFILQTPPAQALNYACALGALVAQHHGANPPISEAEILQLIAENR